MLKKLIIFPFLVCGNMLLAMEQSNPNQAARSDDDKMSNTIQNLEKLIKKDPNQTLSVEDILRNFIAIYNESPQDAKELIEAIVEIASIGFLPKEFRARTPKSQTSTSKSEHSSAP